MLENKIEDRLVSLINKAGGRSYKFNSPSRRDVPDRLNVMRKPIMGNIFFVECKAPGEELRKGQLREIEFLASKGQLVYVLDFYLNDLDELFSLEPIQPDGQWDDYEDDFPA